MSFWETEGVNVEASKINQLIDKGIPLEDLMQEENFLEEYMTQNACIIQYVQNEQILDEILNWMFVVDPIKNYSFDKCQKFTYKSFRIFAEYNIKFTQYLYRNQRIIQKLFSISKLNPYKYIVAQGYLQSIVRNHLTNINENKKMFIDVLGNNLDFLYGLVENPSRANCEIIKDILTNNDENLETVQKKLFDYLIVYYMNERFIIHEKMIRENFQNVQKIITKLGELKIVYPYKQKYLNTLWDIRSIKNSQLTDFLYGFRLTLINYLISTQQITKIPNPIEFLDSHQIFKGKDKIFYLVMILDSILLIERENVYEDNFYAGLFHLAEKHKSSDIIVNKILKIILKQKNDWINHQNLIFGFLEKQGSKFQAQTGSKYNTCYLPADFCEQILQQLDLNSLSNDVKNNLLNFKDKIEKVYKSTIYSVPTDQLPPPLAPINLDDINLFGSNQDLKDARFHDEDYLFKDKNEKPTLDDFTF